jgi:hypothetical protein
VAARRFILRKIAPPDIRIRPAALVFCRFVLAGISAGPAVPDTRYRAAKDNDPLFPTMKFFWGSTWYYRLKTSSPADEPGRGLPHS